MSLVRIHETHIPGYGDPEMWQFTVYYRLWLIDTQNTESERGLDALADRVKAKWRKTKTQLEALVKDKKPDLKPCSVCKTEATEGGASNAYTTWCHECYEALKRKEEEDRIAARQITAPPTEDASGAGPYRDPPPHGDEVLLTNTKAWSVWTALRRADGSVVFRNWCERDGGWWMGCLPATSPFVVSAEAMTKLMGVHSK